MKLVEALAWLIQRVVPGYTVMVLSPCTMARMLAQSAPREQSYDPEPTHGQYV